MLNLKKNGEGGFPRVPNPVNKNVKMMQSIFSLYFEQYLPMWLLQIGDVPVVRLFVKNGAEPEVMEADIVAESGEPDAFAPTDR